MCPIMAAVPSENCETINQLKKTYQTQSCGPSFRASILSSCRICLSSIFDAAFLTCGHSFCERCLDRYWQIKEKPEFIVCPLCRDPAFSVVFAKKQEISSTEDFRKMFDEDSISLQMDNPQLKNDTISVICLKVSILIPAVYFMAKFLKPTIRDLITFLQGRIWSI